jgi:hypothetical protein
MTKAASVIKIGSPARSILFRPIYRVKSEIDAASSMTTLKKMFLGTTYGKKYPGATMTGTNSDTISKPTTIAWEDSGTGLYELFKPVYLWLLTTLIFAKLRDNSKICRAT